MNLPSKNLRTYLMILSDDREIPLTDSQYNAIKSEQAIGKFSDPLTVRDPDTKKIIFDGKIGAIKEFREINRESYAGKRYVCDFGTRHQLSQECNCSVTYGIFAITFQKRAWDKFRKYPIQLTSSEKQAVLTSFS